MIQPNTRTNVLAVHKLTNWVRRQHGQPPLRLDPKLNRTAQDKALEMFWRKYFGHVNPDGKGPPYGENIARGYPTAIDAMEGWRTSVGHHDNMIDSGYRRMGVGYMIKPNPLHVGWTWIWVQHFA